MKCVLVECDHEAQAGDVVCHEHAAYYRRRECDVDVCRWCGRLLATPYALARGYCVECKLSTPAQRVKLLAKKRHRMDRLERIKVRQREQRAARKVTA